MSAFTSNIYLVSWIDKHLPKLIKLPIWQSNGCDKGPYVQEGANPAWHHFDPHGCGIGIQSIQAWVGPKQN